MYLLKLLLLTTSSCLLIILAVSVGLALYVVLPKKPGMERTLSTDAQKGWIDIVSWNRWNKEKVTIQSPFGYSIEGTWLPVPNARGTVLFYHGHSWTRYGSVKYVPIFKKLGFNALIIDLRGHGATGGITCTYGWKEKEDGKACVDWIIAKTSGNTCIGLHGESLGAATALLHAAEDNRISFVIADAAFSSLKALLIARYKALTKAPLFPVFTLVEYIIPLISGGFAMNKSEPIEAVKKLAIPVLFIHGIADDFTPHEMSIAMYETAKQHGNAELYLVPNARHSQSLPVNPTGYEETVTNFFRKYTITE
ncbi:MAG TPA: CocE/NonD family hydrolase [Spirochaetia bacterium]|nr:CocE/NonD family hydrolase [Spirochaetia bacterium]HRV28782.1 CocE/NonD family hydrolase [Spirochaetia bacterium]